ncbi:MAG: polysaccharide deacetylase family protein [Chromatiales bacterium]|jgi:peptidoglycan/xylan/chitin deacetylase (PgdA/CDA1 family)
MRINLKVDAEDFVGISQGIPALLKLFDQYRIQASFFFNLGYDNTGLKIRNLFRPFILSRQLPLRQKLYGTLLAPPNLTKKFRDIMRSCADAGHEVGIKSFDSASWIINASTAGSEWTRLSLQHSLELFNDIFKKPPNMHSSSGFQINPALLQYEEEFGFDFALDTRGKTAFYPEYQGVTSKVVQIPVTLPAIEDLLLQAEITLDNVHEYLFVESQKQLPHGHVYNIRASYEGRDWLPIVEKIIVMWRSSQWEFQSLTESYNSLEKDQLLTHQIGWERCPASRMYCATQSIPLQNV